MGVNKFIIESSGRPVVATRESAGADLRSNLHIVIPAGGNAIVPTAYIYDLPCSAQVRGRSGLAFNHNILAHVGTIDKDYYDKEVYVKLFNLGDKDYEINVGDRIAQIIPDVGRASDYFETKDEVRTGGLGSTDETI